MKSSKDAIVAMRLGCVNLLCQFVRHTLSFADGHAILNINHEPRVLLQYPCNLRLKIFSIVRPGDDVCEAASVARFRGRRKQLK